MFPKIINKLIKAGYEIRECSPYHYHVYCNNSFMNIWPSKNKYMGMLGRGSKTYENASDLIKILGKPTPRKKSESNIVYTAEELKDKVIATQEWETGLSKILSKINKKQKDV